LILPEPVNVNSGLTLRRQNWIADGEPILPQPSIVDFCSMAGLDVEPQGGDAGHLEQADLDLGQPAPIGEAFRRAEALQILRRGGEMQPGSHGLVVLAARKAGISLYPCETIA
jgi:hypothetical protein